MSIHKHIEHPGVSQTQAELVTLPEMVIPPTSSEVVANDEGDLPTHAHAIGSLFINGLSNKSEAGSYISGKERDNALENSNWWQETQAEQLVEESLNEIFQAKFITETQDAPKSLDILNCSKAQLSAEDLQAVQDTLHHVGVFTQGKIFDRVNGVIFADNEKFEDGDLGGYVAKGGFLRLNLEAVRSEEGSLLPRYQRFFKGRSDVDTFKVNLAHELGHALDIHSTTEAAANGVDIKKLWNPGLGESTHAVSAFQEQVGWRHSVEDHREGLFGKVDQWNIDDARMSENNEYPPTAYAATAPHEDFAESFAIASLGGDTSTLPIRTAALQKTLQAAQGRTYAIVTPVIEKLAG